MAGDYDASTRTAKRTATAGVIGWGLAMVVLWSVGAGVAFGDPEIRLSLSQYQRAQLVTTELGVNPATILVNVAVMGGGTYAWSARAECDWLTIDPNSGTSSGNFNLVHIGADVSKVQPGGHVCNLVYECEEAINNPVVVPVYLYYRYDADGVLSVPGEYPTIQAAADTARNGDVILVADGVHASEGNRDVVLRTATTLRSQSGPSRCIIECQGDEETTHQAFICQVGAGSQEYAIEGFTIRNAFSISGGAITCLASGPSIRNCIFVNNYGLNGAAIKGGGACAGVEVPIQITNCTFYGNYSEAGASVVNMEGHGYDAAMLRNCIMKGNSEPQLRTWPVAKCGIPTIDVRYSVLQSDWWMGENNRLVADCEPLFADEGAGDFHLKSQAGRWLSDEGRWTTDEATSPCVDAGDPGSPVGREPFPNGGRVNMGAYGGTAEASKSYFGGPPCETIVAGDINGDCRVDFADFCILVQQWCVDNTP